MSEQLGSALHLSDPPPQTQTAGRPRGARLPLVSHGLREDRTKGGFKNKNKEIKMRRKEKEKRSVSQSKGEK